MNLDYKVFEPSQDANYEELNAFRNKMRSERWPEEPPVSVDETIKNFENIPPFVEFIYWNVWDTDKDIIVAASMNQIFKDVGHNEHLTQFNIDVLPEYRRKGIGRSLFSRSVDFAKTHNKRLMISATDSMIPAGEVFMQLIGAQKGLAEEINRLKIEAVDQTLLKEWIERARERAGDFELGLWEGPIPDGDLDAYIRIEEVMNTAPTGDLDIEDFKWTPEQVRQREASLLARRIERWILYARNKVNEDVAGYTSVFWRPQQAHRLDQGDTAVDPKYRNLGLGRWLKAAMMEKILAERPTVKWVDTGNANSNAPMLKINHEMGFQLYKSTIIWQLDLETAKAYLQNSN